MPEAIWLSCKAGCLKRSPLFPNFVRPAGSQEYAEEPLRHGEVPSGHEGPLLKQKGPS